MWSQIRKQFTCISGFVPIKLNTVVDPRFYKIQRVKNEVQRKHRAPVIVVIYNL